MPVDMSRYPTDWREISSAVKERAGWLCEWCGVPHGAFIIRDKRDGFRYELLSDCEADSAAMDGERVTRVVLTVHHIGVLREDGSAGSRHDKMDNRAENLVSLCQRCHLLADLDLHIANAAETRRRKRIEAGQTVMFAEVSR